jgi:hypothetical protein
MRIASSGRLYIEIHPTRLPEASEKLLWRRRSEVILSGPTWRDRVPASQEEALLWRPITLLTSPALSMSPWLHRPSIGCHRSRTPDRTAPCVQTSNSIGLPMRTRIVQQRGKARPSQAHAKNPATRSRFPVTFRASQTRICCRRRPLVRNSLTSHAATAGQLAAGKCSGWCCFSLLAAAIQISPALMCAVLGRPSLSIVGFQSHVMSLCQGSSSFNLPVVD